MNPKFVSLKGNYYNLSQILAVKQVPSSKGKDKVMRSWIVVLSPDVVGGPRAAKYTSVWCSDNEVKDVLKVMQEINNEEAE